MTDEALIRPRIESDLDALAAVLVQVHERDGYPVEGVGNPRGWLTPAHTLGAWVAVLHGEPIGHVLLTEPGEGDAAALLWHDQTQTPLPSIAVGGRLFVSPAARRHHLGERLTDAASRGAEDLGRRAVLDVMAKDVAAIATYERLGWARIGSTVHEVKGGPGVDAWCFVAPLVG